MDWYPYIQAGRNRIGEAVACAVGGPSPEGVGKARLPVQAHDLRCPRGRQGQRAQADEIGIDPVAGPDLEAVVRSLQERAQTLVEMAEEIIDFWAENALEHERCGEMIERIGLVNFLEGIGIDVDPNMVSSPRQSSYVRMDGWDEEAEKWFERKREEKQAASA